MCSYWSSFVFNAWKAGHERIWVWTLTHKICCWYESPVIARKQINAQKCVHESTELLIWTHEIWWTHENLNLNARKFRLRQFWPETVWAYQFLSGISTWESIEYSYLFRKLVLCWIFVRCALYLARHYYRKVVFHLVQSYENLQIERLSPKFRLFQSKLSKRLITCMNSCTIKYLLWNISNKLRD